MGRHASITLDDVKTAVAVLHAEGKNVSSRSVREKLGSVGSMGTVNKLLQQALNEKEEKPSSLRQLPSELQRAFLNFADEQAEEARKEIAEELMHCRYEMNALAEDNELVCSKVGSLQEQLAESMAQTANLEGRLKQLASELQLARKETMAERSNAESSRIELVKLQIRLDGLKSLDEDLRSSKAQCEDQRDACTKLEQTVAVLEVQRNSLEQQHSSLQADLAHAHLLYDKLIEKVEAISSMVDKEREARMLAERELAVMSATYAKRRLIGKRTNTGKQQAS